MDLAYWYRFANRVDPDFGKVPADEVAGQTEVLLSVHPRVGIGPTASGFTRLGGIALDGTADYTDPDLFSSLRATQVKVGGKLALYALDNGPTVSIAVLQTVYAENNPSDTLSLSLGVGQWIVPRPPPVTPPD